MEERGFFFLLKPELCVLLGLQPSPYLTDCIWGRPRRNMAKHVNYSDTPLLSPNAPSQVGGESWHLDLLFA